MCIAKLTSGSSQSLTLQGYQDENFAIRIKDEVWQLQDRQINIVVEVGASKWAVDATAYQDGNVVIANFDYVATAKQFMNTVSGGRNLKVSTESGTMLAKFELAGSKDAMATFFECWARLKVPVKVLDPFAEVTPVTDPFAKTETTDPFAAKPNVEQSSEEEFEYTSRDSTGVIYSVTIAKKGTTSNGTNGVVFISTNKSGRDHKSFGMYDDCTAYSLRQGWGNWSWDNGGFFVDFSDQEGYSFPRGETHPTLGGGCKM
jgi:hypothetical protein